MRRSPSINCPFCNSRDWSYDQDQLRWVCTSCLVAGRPIPDRPSFDDSFDFDRWYESVMDDWNTINIYVADLEKQSPETERDKIILGARLKKAQTELSRANDLATVASYVRMMMHHVSTGDLYINIPDIEFRVKW